MKITEFHKPKDINELSELLLRNKNKSHILLHGTYPTPLTDINVNSVIDMSETNLRYISTDDNNIIIGSLTTIQDLIDSEILRTYSDGIVSKAAKLVAPYGIRNIASINGTLLSKFSAPEICLILMSLNAIPYFHPSKEKTLPLIYEDQDNNSILIKILIPIKNTITAFERISRTPLDKSIICSAIGIDVHDNHIIDARVSIAGIDEMPVRLPIIESAIIEKDSLSLPNIDIIIKNAVTKSANTNHEDYRGSSDYRLEMASILTERAINQVKKQYANQSET